MRTVMRFCSRVPCHVPLKIGLILDNHVADLTLHPILMHCPVVPVKSHKVTKGLPTPIPGPKTAGVLWRQVSVHMEMIHQAKPAGFGLMATN